jgi:hypothetical protein
MLEAAGMKETWLFQKARVLAIFDDLDTILLMVPLKVIIVGLKWELSFDLIFVIVLLGLSWFYLHAIKIPVSSGATLSYAALVTTVCELVHVITHYHIEAMDTVHLEVLLPAFAIGCIARSAHAEDHHVDQLPKSTAVVRAQEQLSCDDMDHDMDGDSHPAFSSPQTGKWIETTGKGGMSGSAVEHFHPTQPQQQQQQQQQSAGGQQKKLSRRSSIIMEAVQVADAERIGATISAIFMVLVGLSMPGLFGGDSEQEEHRRRLASGSSSSSSSDGSEQMSAGVLVAHVVAVSVLMIIGKMFPTCCYSSEANLKTRFALSLGMCPRGEVGAGVIVISLGFGIQGSAITIAVIALAINLILSSGFIMAVKHLAREPAEGPAQVHQGTMVQVVPCASQDGHSDTRRAIDSWTHS